MTIVRKIRKPRGGKISLQQTAGQLPIAERRYRELRYRFLEIKKLFAGCLTLEPGWAEKPQRKRRAA